MTNTFQTISPIDNSIIVEKNYSTELEISTTVELASQAQTEWSKTPIKQRALICLKAVDALLANHVPISEEITKQMGRPIQYSVGEIAGFSERARYMIGIAEEKLADIHVKEIEGFNRFIRRQSLGVICVISPWNYPYLTAVNSIIPAIMSGNAVVLKPSAQTPLIAERIKETFDVAGLPNGVFQCLYLDHQSTRSLIQNDDISHVAFTGSVKGGLAVQDAAKNRFIGLGLELGGKDPAYVRADVNLDTVVPNLVDGTYFNSGQSCCGIERIYVHESIYEEFVERFVKEVNNYVLGDPMDTSTTLGPMVRISAADFVRQQIEDAVAAGATACIDPANFPANKVGSAYLAPQVLVDVDHTMSVMRDESFGPVVGIMKVASDVEAIELMNDSEFGLTASVWTKDEATALTMGNEINAGTFFMNRCDYLDPALAWSGFKNSGRGCTLSEVGYEQLTRPKSFHLKRKES